MGLQNFWKSLHENHDSYTYSAISNDLYHWDVCGKEINYNSHEGPNVFELGGKKWMITDEWNGLGVYETQDYTHWERQGVYSTLRIRIFPMNIDWISHILPMQRTAEHAYRQRSWK